MKNQILQFTKDFIAIQSVSADPSRSKDMARAIEFLKKKLKSLGFAVTVLEKKEAKPMIIATLNIKGASKTIGIYGHYDVQPEDPVSEWKSGPFDLTLRKGKMYGRGIADDKGHVIQNIVAIESLIADKTLKNNIVFMFEGEEEEGSVNLEYFAKKAAPSLKKVDVFYVTDSGMHAKNIPNIEYGLRGLVYYELEVSIGSRDLHSGVYGNRVLNPAQVIADLFARMKDIRTGRVLIPGFYNNLRKPTAKELKALKKTARSDKAEKEEANVYGVVSLDKKYPYLSPKIYPSLDIHGLVSGYTGEGTKTIIPAKASVKFSTRLVEHQDPDKIFKMMSAFVKKNMPKEVKYKLILHSKAAPFFTDIDNVYMKKTAAILSSVFGHETLFNRSGGSIPVAEVLSRLFKTPIVLTGFTLPDDNIHSPNENFDEDMFFKGIEALKMIYSSI